MNKVRLLLLIMSFFCALLFFFGATKMIKKKKACKPYYLTEAETLSLQSKPIRSVFGNGPTTVSGRRFPEEGGVF